MEPITYKLYSPLTAEHLPGTDIYWREDAIEPLRGRDLTGYAAVIAEWIEREGADLEQYIDHENTPYLAAHVKSIRLSVEERDGELCGCATVAADEKLEQEGWYELHEYLTGQYSDGWGEGFEQRNIPVEGGVLNVHFWQPDYFYFREEQVQPTPQEERSSAASDGQRKYEITDIAHPVYPELHRIRALRQVAETVGPGTMGGYIQSEENLSQEKDTAWIYGEAICRDNALVTKGAVLTGHAQVSGAALVCGKSEIGDSACVKDHAVVMAGTVQGNARVCGGGLVTKNADTEYAPVVEGSATVMGTVAGAIYLSENAFILPGSIVDNPTTDVLAINGKGARLYSIETQPSPPSPER